MTCSRRKVVHLVAAGALGGAERFLVGLASNADLTEADHSIALMTPNPELRQLFSKAGLRIWDRGHVSHNPAADLWHAFGPADVRWLAGVLADEDADLLHVHTYRSHTLGVRTAHRAGVPLLRTEHGVDHYRDLSCAIGRKWTLRRTDRVVAVSDFVRQVVVNYLGEISDRTEVVLNGVDVGRFEAEPPKTSGPFTFGVLGRIEPVKQFHLAVRAMVQVPDAKLVVVGDGSQRRALEEMSRGLGLEERVRFSGYLDDPRPAVRACDVLINCSRIEACSVAILEAMSMARPVIAFATGGNSELIENGRTGWLVTDKSAEGLATIMREVSASRDRTAILGQNARARVVTQLSLERMCRDYANTYRELAKRQVSGKRSAQA
jgi:glycosyltransferase involved in cell wall biosynthesis